MMLTIQDQVRAFHEAMGVRAPVRPEIPPYAEVRLRLRLVAEEFFELLGSCVQSPGALAKLERLESDTDDLISVLPLLRVDLPEFADALADLAYVVYGTALVSGIDLDEVVDEVHASNMSKTGGPVREDGKVMKGPNYVPPDIEKILAKQGWQR